MSALIVNIDDVLSMDDVPDGVVVCGNDGEILAINAAFSDLFGYAEDELIGKKIEVLVPVRHSGHAEVRKNYQNDPVKRPMGKVQQMFGVRKDGTEVPIDISLKPAVSGDHVICFARDISEHIRLTEEMRRLAYFDPITNTLNRRAFNEALKSALSDKSDCGKGLCVSLFDLDHFKDVNDTLGHSVGDELLVAFCDRLREVMCDTMRLYRVGGDEFALIMPTCPSRERGLTFVESAIYHLRKPFMICGHEITIGCSAGVVQAPTDGNSAEELISNADLALYKAKATRGTYAAFVPELRDSVEERFSLLSDLRIALDQEQFVLHFQPKVDVRTGIVNGAEALLRWEHPTEGLLPPARFIDVVSDSELSLELGRWVMNEACARAAEWGEMSGRPVNVAVNLFPRQAKSKFLCEDVERALLESRLKPKFLEIELTENTIIDSSQQFIDVLNQFRGKGITIALDDFGTGYASLNSLTDFPIDVIKIDKGFVQGISKGLGNSAVLKAMAMLCRELGLISVAEGVECVEDALLVQHYGFDLGQGYYWGRPVPHAEFMDMLERPMKNSPSADRARFAPMPIDYLEKILKNRFPKSA